MTDDRGASAILQENPDILENLEDADWQHDPENPRNWPFAKKWTTTAVVSVPHYSTRRCSAMLQVSLYTFVSPLTSSIMAPGLPEVATKYNISNETIVALTLSIFLISFGIAVSRPR
jgi:hypothetical protein